MTDIFTLENKIKQIIDELKGLCQTNGLSNQASEEVVITSVFLYKFLNDKFMANLKEFAEEMDMTVGIAIIAYTMVVDSNHLGSMLLTQHS